MNVIFTPGKHARFKRITRFLAYLPLILISNQSLTGQSCFYSVELFDAIGDGWNGAVLTVTVAGTPTDYTLLSGNTDIFSFAVNEGNEISLEYSPGVYELEVSYNLLDSEGFVVFSDGSPPQTGFVFSTNANCPLCPRPDPSNVDVLVATDISAAITWGVSPGAFSYIVEYGPSGFPPGVGVIEETNNSFVTIGGLNPCVTYDVYIYAVCGPDIISSPTGPVSFTTTYSDLPIGGPCNYSLEMFSENGIGWQGAFLIVTVDGVSYIYNLFFGFQLFDNIFASQNQHITVEYVPGFSDQNVSYIIKDPFGNIVFSDGPFPQAGVVLDFIACADCAIPSDFRLADRNADNVKVAWSAGFGPAGDYVLEYGSLGFTKGTGTILNLDSDVREVPITGLTENTWYDIYIQAVCDTNNLSKPIGPITFKTLYFNDVGVAGITHPRAEDCNLSEDENIAIQLANFGQKPQTLFNFKYAVNGVPASIPIPTDGFFTGVIGNDSLITIEFETTYDFSKSGYYVIEAWTEMEEDSDVSNDTFRYELITALPKPLMEDFESGVFPDNWTTDAFTPIYLPFDHNNPTTVIASNIFDGNGLWETVTHRVGVIAEGDILSFDYRYVDWFAGTVPTIIGPNDQLQIQISTDCGNTFETVFTVDGSNHVPTADMTTREVDLSDFAGQAINIRFLATWGQGDYWLDLDNINIPGCPDDFGLVFNTVIKPSVNGEPNGSIDVNPIFGTPPYSYVWNTGANTNLLSGLGGGLYTVTVTDANGCMDEMVFEVGSVVGTEEVISIQSLTLSPNPTTGPIVLDVELSKPADMEIQLFTLNGQLLFGEKRGKVRHANVELNLGEYPNGIYLARILTKDLSHFEKIILSK